MTKELKLYKATRIVEVMFVADKHDDKHIKDLACDFLEKESENMWDDVDDVQEVTSKKQVPKEWSDGVLVWGIDELEHPELIGHKKDLSVGEYFNINNPNKQKIRLKIEELTKEIDHLKTKLEE